MQQQVKTSKRSEWGYILEAGFEYFISILLSGAYLARITGTLGFSDSLTGILSSFVSLGCLFRLAAIVVMRNVKSVKHTSIVIGSIHDLLFMLVYLTPIVSMSQAVKTALFLICFAAAHIVNNLILPARGAWMISLIDDKSRGVFTAKKEMVSLLGGMTFSYAMGSLVDYLEAQGQVRTAFIVGAVAIAMLGIFHIGSMVVIQDAPAKAGEKRDLKETFRFLTGDKMLRKILTVNIIWQIASHCATPFFGAYQIRELGFSMTFVSVLSIVTSVVRMGVSTPLGRYADRTSFVRMSYLCYMIVGAAFLATCFAVPENGKVMFIIYYCLHGIAMGGINSSITNLVCDHVKGDMRKDAMALNSGLSGVAGFGATCLMSPVVAHIQNNGNRIFSISIHAAQFGSIVTVLLIVVLIVYMKKALIGKKSA